MSRHILNYTRSTRLRNDDLVFGTLHWSARVGNPDSREIGLVSRLSGCTWHLAAAPLCREARQKQEFRHRDDRGLNGCFT
jgi:hypothetical protein